ncbi:MAG: menaquinone biosynthesis decarboxylase, partial [Gemmatimonadaceae bacterium]
MTIDTLSEFVERLEQAGELQRIREPISANLEITEIADRVMKQPGGGKALLFEKPVLMNGKPSEFPVGINLFGSMRRIEMALGAERLDAIGDRITELLQTKPPQGLVAKLALLPKLLELAKFPPRKHGGTPPCQEVVWRAGDVDLDRLPLMK